MSKFRRAGWGIIAFEIGLLIFCNILYGCSIGQNEKRLYRVEAKRAAQMLRESDAADIDLTGFSTIISIREFHEDEDGNEDYIVEDVNGTLYRIEYKAEPGGGGMIYFNAALAVMIGLTAGILIYIDRKVLKPFAAMQHLPSELARGNLAVPIKGEKSKLFGGFLWGMDMLRENLEEKREKELQLQKEKKTLILSLSHDIKTPVSAIQLYVRALLEDLYDTEEKKSEALSGIAKNAGEIEKYINEITKASREDFLNLEVHNGECYLSDVISIVKEYYKEKLSVIHTEFVVEPLEDCLLHADQDRLVEVLQNLMENAIKYGDGGSIRLLFGQEEDCQLIQVENTGRAPDEEELPHIFDSFYRGSNHKNKKGSGLGLYICKKLMRKMDGDVFAETGENRFCVTVVIRKA